MISTPLLLKWGWQGRNDLYPSNQIKQKIEDTGSCLQQVRTFMKRLFLLLLFLWFDLVLQENYLCKETPLGDHPCRCQPHHSFENPPVFKSHCLEKPTVLK